MLEVTGKIPHSFHCNLLLFVMCTFKFINSNFKAKVTLKTFIYLFIFVYLHIPLWWDTYTTIQEQRAKDNLQELVLFLHHVDPGHLVHLARLGGKHFFPLDHLAGTSLTFLL